jgi:hypothetical protein
MDKQVQALIGYFETQLSGKRVAIVPDIASPKVLSAHLDAGQAWQSKTKHNPQYVKNRGFPNAINANQEIHAWLEAKLSLFVTTHLAEV